MIGRISSSRFVGRVAELEALDRLLLEADSGRGGAMLVAGEAGIGKSRLVGELEARARAVDALVLRGECLELAEAELAFAPVISALRGVMEDGEALEGLGPPLRSALAAVWSVPGAAKGGGDGRQQLFEAVYRVLARVARRQPVLLIVEDVHWIDRSSRDLLAFLVRNARRDAIALVATYRPDELHRGHPLRPFLAELERSGQANRVELEPLARSELAEQLEAIAGHRPAAAVVERIFARCEGNPFFAEELLAGGDAPGGALPGSVREALLLRFERLSKVTREVLRVAAVVGRSVDHRLLTGVVGVAESELLVALREASDQYLLVPGGGTSYVFRHALLREAIYEDTLVGERLRLHRMIAKTLEAHPELAGANAAAELAHHWLVAGEDRAALQASLEAATEAAAMHAYDEAAGHIKRALELWDRLAAPEEGLSVDRIDLLLQASELADNAGEAETALALAEQARAGLDETVEPLRAASAETRIARALMYSARAADAVDHLAAARRLVPKDPPSLDYLEVLAHEGRLMMLNGRMIEARGRLEEAIPLAEQLGAHALHAGTLSALAIVYSNLGEQEKAIVAGRECIRLANQSGSAEQIARTYINGSQAIDDAGRIGEALAIGRDGIAAADRLGLSRGAGDQLRMQAGWRLLRMGRLEDAERVIQPGLDGATAPFNVAGLLSISGRLAAERGEFDVAEERLDHSWELMQRSGGFQLIAPNIAWRALLRIYSGELERAHECVADGLRRVARSEGDLIYNAELFWLAARLAADLAQGPSRPPHTTAAEQAAEAATVAIAQFDRVIALAGVDRAPPEGLAFRALAEAELARLRREHDPDPWREAGKLFGSLDERLRAAYTRFREAEALALSGGDAEEIRAPVREAHETAMALGARSFQAQVETFAQEVGLPLDAQKTSSDRAGETGKPATDEVLELLSRTRRGTRRDRLLATIMFTDIVGSTARAADLGDLRWRELLDQHEQLVRAEVKRFGGVVVQFIGDGTLSTFDGPGRAIHCACALLEAVKPLGIEIRAGVHTGEIEVRGEDIGGIAVHIGARVAALAARSEILVSQTVADVVAGSGIQFESRGAHELKGVPGTWQLSAVILTNEGTEL